MRRTRANRPVESKKAKGTAISMSEAQLNQKSIPHSRRERMKKKRKSKANSRQDKNKGNSRQEKSIANSRQKKNKKTCEKAMMLTMWARRRRSRRTRPQARNPSTKFETRTLNSTLEIERTATSTSTRR